MAETKKTFESIREWVVEHKLRTVGCLWLTGIAGSIAYNWSKPNMKTSVKIIHASGRVLLTEQPSSGCMHKRLVGAAIVEYVDHKTGAKAERVAKFLNVDGHSQKD